MNDVNAIPEGMTAVTPYLILDDANGAIEFCKEAFGAEERYRMVAPGTDIIMHAEIVIGGAVIMLGQHNADWGSLSPKELGGSPAFVHLYVDDADAVQAKAVAAGATEEMAVTEMFWGDRMGKIVDPHGYCWSIGTHVADPTPEEMEAGLKAMMSGEGRD